MQVEKKNRYESIFRLDGKVIVVTGACGFLGSQYCRALAEFGARVIVADLEESKCLQLTFDINKDFSGKAFSMPVNLANEESIVVWAEDIISKFGRVDVLINNAATKTPNFFNDLEDYPLQDWNDVMKVNVDAVFLAIREIGSHMAKNGGGAIINVSSIYGIVGPDQRIYDGSWHESLNSSINTPLIYSATKGAIISMTRYLAAYWGNKGVRTNCITPGGVEDAQNVEFNKRYSEKVPLGRMAKSDEMIGAVLYLSSDSSSYVNGHNLVVDGGWTAW